MHISIYTYMWLIYIWLLYIYIVSHFTQPKFPGFSGDIHLGRPPGSRWPNSWRQRHGTAPEISGQEWANHNMVCNNILDHITHILPYDITHTTIFNIWYYGNIVVYIWVKQNLGNIFYILFTIYHLTENGHS